MRVLIACEESQAVCKAFRSKGHEAYSADLQDCSGGHPEWHIKGDVTPLLSEKWDMIIAFPPCTFLTVAGACNIPKDLSRIEKGFEAARFFMQFYNADCPRVCVENPRPLAMFNLPKCSQVIEPYMFGHPYTKRTYLWLKGLPELVATNIVVPRASWVRQKKGSKIRSKTFPGVVAAMADQWTDFIYLL